MLLCALCTEVASPRGSDSLTAVLAACLHRDRVLVLPEFASHPHDHMGAFYVANITTTLIVVIRISEARWSARA